MSNLTDWFVNRLKQMDGFAKMLARQTPKQIMVIEAPAELGKSWTLQRLQVDCRGQGVLVALVDFRDRQPWDYLLLTRQLRDQLGNEHFNLLTTLINQSTTIHINLTTSEGSGGPVNLNLATEGGQISSSPVTIGDIAGGTIVKDNQFVVHADSETARRAIELRITDAFVDALKVLSQTHPVVLLFDSYEDATAEADRWLRFSFLTKIRDALLPNVIVIIAGRTAPSIDPSWQPFVARTGLAPLEEIFVREYIVEKRKLTGLDLATIIRTCGGHPGLLAKMADIATMDKSEEKDWGL